MSIASKESLGAVKLQLEACKMLPKATLANLVADLMLGKVL